jgi:hypothetical protein
MVLKHKSIYYRQVFFSFYPFEHFLKQAYSPQLQETRHDTTASGWYLAIISTWASSLWNQVTFMTPPYLKSYISFGV